MRDFRDPRLAGQQSLHKEASPLLEGYVLDALEPDETALVNAHLDEGCEDCANDVGVLRRVLRLLPWRAPLIEVRTGLKQRIFGEIDAPPPTAREAKRPPSPIRKLWPWGERDQCPKN